MGEEHEFEAVVAALAADPACADFASPAAAVLLWNSSADRILWASAAAAPLRNAFAPDESGAVAADLPARMRLKALAQGLAPKRGVRLERLRFDSSVASPTTCACRRIALPSGEEALATLIMAPLPRIARRPIGAAEQPRDVGPSDASERRLPSAVAERVAGSAPEASRGTVRFLWQADALGRFVHVSAALEDLVGLAGADIVGRTWGELAGSVVEDTSGEVARAFAERDTWSHSVLWRIGRGDGALTVDFAGTPIYGRDRRLSGFRGFGLARVDNVVPWGAGGAPSSGVAGVEAARSTAAPSTGAQETRQQAVADRRAGSAEADDNGDNASDAAQAGAEAGIPGSKDAIPGFKDAPRTGPSPSFMPLSGTAKGRLGDAAPPLRVVEEIDTPLDIDQSPAPASTRPAGGERRESTNLSRLSTAERSAFRDIARALGARFASDDRSEPHTIDEPTRRPSNVASLRPAPSVGLDTMRVLDRLPAGILVHRGDTPLFANRLLLDLVDYADVGEIEAEGGVARLFRGRSATLARVEESASPIMLASRANESIPVEVRLTTVEWDGLPASLMLIRRVPENDPAQRLRALELELRARDAKLRELSSILDTATDGVVILDDDRRILSINRSAEALFGYDQNEVAGESFTVLLAPESHSVALDYLAGLSGSGVASLLNDGREVLARVRQGGMIPLSMTMGRITEGPERKFCAVLRDITAFKKAEGELMAAKRSADDASGQKSDFLAKINHEIRTPLSAIIGFAEVMLEERFGAVGNERYKDYLQDILSSGKHVVGLVNDLLDLAKIEAGRLELAFTGVNLNELVTACVSEMQPQATRERIVLRTSFAAKLPPVVADERSIRQVVANVLSNAVKFTEPGGQVIVSTAMTDRGEVAFRVRDTGVGMTKEEVDAALQPFRQTAVPRKGGGTGLGLPLTKALVEANRGALLITSARNEGTLVEVLFPPTRVLAD